MSTKKKLLFNPFLSLLSFGGFYVFLLIIRITAKPILNKEPSGLQLQLTLIMFAFLAIYSLWLVWRLNKENQSKYGKKDFRAFIWYIVPSGCAALLMDYIINDQNRFLSGGTWSNLYDVTIFLTLLCTLYVIKKGQWIKSETINSQENLTVPPIQFYSRPSLGQNDEDRLGRKEFVGHLADILKSRLNETYENALTIGLYGPWGSGKTSIFDMLERDENLKYKIIRFHPWYMGKDYTNIIPEFLKLLIKTLKEQDYPEDKELLRLLASYRNYLKPVSLKLSILTLNFKEIHPLSEFSKEYADAQRLREQIIHLLKGRNIPLVICIDDLDRLDNKEIQMVFKLVRLIADFPNVTYIIAMDEEMVARSLAQMYSKDYDLKTGLKYLDKFIHVPLYMPQPDPEMLAQYFISGMNTLLAKQNILLDEMVMRDIVLRFHFTLWNFERLMNLAFVYFPMLGKDTYAEDLLALLAIKIDNPELYHFIYRNSGLFLGVASDTEKEVLRKEIGEKYYSYISLIVKLFPQFSSPQVINDEIKRNKRICSPDHFPTYFKYGVAYRQVSQAQMDLLYSELRRDLTSGIKAYSELVNDTGIEQVNNNIRMQLDSNNSVFNQLLLKLMFTRHPDYSTVDSSTSDLMNTLVACLIVNAEEAQQTLELLCNYSGGFYMAARATYLQLPKATKDELKAWVNAQFSLNKLDAYNQDEKKIILISWMEEKSKEELRQHFTVWGNDHHIWDISAANSIYKQYPDEVFAMLEEYTNLIQLVPVEYVDRDVEEYGPIVKERIAFDALAEGETPSKITIIYGHHRCYEWAGEALDKIINAPGMNNWHNIMKRFELLMDYGLPERTNLLMEKWEAAKAAINWQ